MAGIGKRQAEYVPQEYRERLDKLSKADLMELAWSFASIMHEDSAPRAFAALVEERGILDDNLGIKQRKI